MIHGILSPSSFSYSEGIFIQKENSIDKAFEAKYLLLRQKENRIYSNETLHNLPFIEKHHPLKKEWEIRKKSTNDLIHVLQTKNIHRILEVGCGNGWLTNQLAQSLAAEVCGIDINEFELLQGAKVFGLHPNLVFVLGNIFTIPFPHLLFDCIVLPSSIQYFPDLTALITRLFELLSEKGEIHIIDSPIYKTNEIYLAKQRTVNYYSKSGFAEMSSYYFHHTWNDLALFKIEMLHDPSSLKSKLNAVLKQPTSPFPWIKISRP